MITHRSQQKDNPYGVINEVTEQTFIVAYKEDISELVKALRKEGLSPVTVRKKYSPDESSYSPIIKCMMTHMEAWEKCTDNDGISLIVEADFVPVVGFGKYHLPYDVRNAKKCIGYLYAGGPQVWDIDELGFARGHAGALVAYSITAPIARHLLAYGHKILSERDPRVYFPFDAGLGYYLKDLGIQSYIPYQMLGEHGGIPNPEHRSYGLRTTHRADTLAKRLYYLPIYAQSSTYKYYITRFNYWLRGVYRLLFFKYVALNDIIRAKNKLKLLRFAIGRHLLI